MVICITLYCEINIIAQSLLIILKHKRLITPFKYRGEEA